MIELQAALADATVDRIVLAAGTYAYDALLHPGCGGSSWLCLTTDNVRIEAAEAGTVVLDAQRAARVFGITATGAQLIGLNITGGYVSSVGARI